MSDIPGWLAWIGGGIAAAVVAWLLYRGLWQDRSRGRARCPKCWYEMKGSEGRPCPECGHLVSEARKYFKTRRHWGNVVLAVVLGVMVMNGPAVRRRVVEDKEKWWEALEPTWVVILRRPLIQVSTPSTRSNQIPARLVNEMKRLTGWHVWWFAQSARLHANASLAASEADLVIRFMNEMRAHRAAVTELIRRGGDENEPATARRLAILFLGNVWQDRRVAGALVKALEDKDGRVGYAALEVCAKGNNGKLGTWTEADLVEVLGAISGMQSASHLMRFDAGKALLGELRERKKPEAGTALLEVLKRITPARAIGDVELQMLMTARRLRGEPDPLVLEIVTQGPMDCTPGDMWRLSVRIMNRDASGLTIRYREFCKPIYNNWRLRVQMSEVQSEVAMANMVAPAVHVDLPDLGPGEKVEVMLQPMALTPEWLKVRTAQELMMHVEWQQWMGVAPYWPRETVMGVKSGEIALRVRPGKS